MFRVFAAAAAVGIAAQFASAGEAPGPRTEIRGSWWIRKAQEHRRVERPRHDEPRVIQALVRGCVTLDGKEVKVRLHLVRDSCGKLIARLSFDGEHRLPRIDSVRLILAGERGFPIKLDLCQKSRDRDSAEYVGEIAAWPGGDCLTASLRVTGRCDSDDIRWKGVDLD